LRGRAKSARTYLVEHHSCAEHVDASVVRPLNVVQIRAVDLGISTVKDLVSTTDQADVERPSVRLGRPLIVSLVASVGIQARCNVEETALRNRVLVVVAVVESENLPSQTSSTRLVVPSRGLTVEDCLCQGKPARLVIGGVRVANFGGRHGCHAPEGLIVVSERLGLVLRLIVHGSTSLVEHGLCCDFVVGVRTSVVPVIDEGAEHGSGFPPVVRVSEQTRNTIGCVSVVEGHHLEGGIAGGGLDRFCMSSHCQWLATLPQDMRLTGVIDVELNRTSQAGSKKRRAC
jgi:hypothetical protein